MRQARDSEDMRQAKRPFNAKSPVEGDALNSTWCSLLPDVLVVTFDILMSGLTPATHAVKSLTALDLPCCGEAISASLGRLPATRSL